MKIIPYFLAALISLGVIQAGESEGGWLVYRQGPFQGKVLDGESKEPIEGAVVIVRYYVRLFTLTGWRSDMIDVEEALTDARGEFQIPVYTTTINPLSVADDVSFLIWKPGYKKEEKWGGYFFAKEPGIVEDRPVQTDKGFEIQAVRLGIIELSQLKSLKERLKMIPDPVGDFSYFKKQKNFIRLINEECKIFGLQPYKQEE